MRKAALASLGVVAVQASLIVAKLQHAISQPWWLILLPTGAVVITYLFVKVPDLWDILIETIEDWDW